MFDSTFEKGGGKIYYRNDPVKYDLTWVKGVTAIYAAHRATHK